MSLQNWLDFHNLVALAAGDTTDSVSLACSGRHFPQGGEEAWSELQFCVANLAYHSKISNSLPVIERVSTSSPRLFESWPAIESTKPEVRGAATLLVGPEGFDSKPKPGTCAGLLPRHVTGAPGLMGTRVR